MALRARRRGAGRGGELRAGPLQRGLGVSYGGLDARTHEVGRGTGLAFELATFSTATEHTTLRS